MLKKKPLDRNFVTAVWAKTVDYPEEAFELYSRRNSDNSYNTGYQIPKNKNIKFILERSQSTNS